MAKKSTKRAALFGQKKKSGSKERTGPQAHFIVLKRADQKSGLLKRADQKSGSKERIKRAALFLFLWKIALILVSGRLRWAWKMSGSGLKKKSDRQLWVPVCTCKRKI